MELKGDIVPAIVGGSGQGSHAMHQLQTNHVLLENHQAASNSNIKPAPSMKLLPKQPYEVGSGIKVWLPGEDRWQAAVYVGCSSEGVHAVLLKDETRFIEVPVGTKFKQTVICSVQEGNHLVNEPPMAPDEPVFQLLHTADGKPRNSYSHIEALPTSGPTSSCGACCSYAHWTAVVGGKAHGQYHSQAVAAYVADCVRQHFDPDATHLNFTPEVWQQVASQLDPAEVPTPEAIQALIAETMPPSSQAPSQGCVGPTRRNQSHPEQQQQQQDKQKQSLCYQPYGRPTITQRRHDSSSGREAPGAAAAPVSQPSPAAAAPAAAAAAHQRKLEQICRTLQRGEQVILCCRSQSASGLWEADGRQVVLAVQGVLGFGGNAEVYQVQLISHLAAAGQLPAAAANAARNTAGAAAAAAAWWARLESCKAAAAAAAADAPAHSTCSSYHPAQHFALKLPRPYECLPPEYQQRMTRGDFCDASYMVLQNEQQVLSCTARSDHVIHCHAYGVIKYGLLPWQQLPCLLLERAAGSVQQKLEEHQAAAAPGHHIRPAGLPEGEVWRIMKIVMPGMIAVAEADIVWKDVKPSNIVYAARSRGRALPVLCDFGSSKLVGPDGLEIAAAPGGTSAFVSPEFKYGRRVGRACDVWGFGCLLLALRLGREVQLLPDVEPDGAAASWDAAAVLREFEGELTSREMSFVAQCLTYEASARPAILALGRHEYFRPAGLANHWQAVGAMMLLE